MLDERASQIELGDVLRDFQRDGFARLGQVLSSSEISALRERCKQQPKGPGKRHHMLVAILRTLETIDHLDFQGVP